MFFLADDVLDDSTYVWADSWEEAERICKEDRLTLVGEYISTTEIEDEEVDEIRRWLYA